jgi:hypothetical protein
MKQLAVSTLSLALLGGSAAAQTPYAAQPYAAPAPVTPVRVHMGGALTKGGVVPVPVYLQSNAAAPAAKTTAQHLPPANPPAPIMATPLVPVLPPTPPLGSAPVRVHLGGALTTHGVMPTPLYLQSNARGSQTIVNMAPGVVPSTHASRQANLPVRQASLSPEALPPPAVHVDAACADGSCEVPFYPPSMDHARRPNREPHGHHFYTTFDYLHWWVRRQESPPLAQINGDLIRAEDFDGSTRDGGRFTLGIWLDTDCATAIEGVFLFLGEQSKGRTLTSNGFPELGRPFIRATTGLPDVLPIADVGVPGAIAMDTHARLFGFEVNLRRELYRTAGGHVDLLLGYRQLYLDEGLRVTDKTTFADTTIIGVDQFGTHNRVYAGQIGLEAEVSWRRLFFDIWGKFGFGGNGQTVDIDGYTKTVTSTGTEVLPGDVLTQPSNIGRYRDTTFTVIPEVGVNVGLRITPNWRVAVGYAVLAIDNVVRPGDQIDPAFAPDGSRPAPPRLTDATYWAHGINAQMEIRY